MRKLPPLVKVSASDLSSSYESEIGVGRMPSFPRDLVGMQLAPFRWKKIVEDNADTWYVPASTPTVFHTPSS
jgi:hypothetical protein